MDLHLAPVVSLLTVNQGAINSKWRFKFTEDYYTNRMNNLLRTPWSFLVSVSKFREVLVCYRKSLVSFSIFEEIFTFRKVNRKRTFNHYTILLRSQWTLLLVRDLANNDINKLDAYLQTVFQLLLQLALGPLTVNEAGRFLKVRDFQANTHASAPRFWRRPIERMIKLPSPTLNYEIVSHCLSLEILQINIHCEAFR